MRWILALALMLAAGSAVAAEPQPPYFTPRDCGAGLVLPDGIAVECGTVTVLEDRSRPDGPRINLAVATLWRTDRELRPDPVLYINSGPGSVTGVDAEWLSGWATVPKTSDWLGARRLVLFDPRGVGDSGLLPSPCGPLDPYQRQFILDHNQPRRDISVAALRRNAKGCWARFRKAGHDPGQITTAAIAADVADLRRALGYSTWNLWGFAFGSRVAMTVMRDHPEGVRAAILEGVLPPEANFYDSAANVGEAFDALLVACSADPGCAEGYPDLERRFLALAERFDRAPLMVPLSGGETARIDGWMFGDAVNGMLESNDRARFIPRMIEEIEAGNPRLLASSKKMDLLDLEIRELSWDQSTYISVACADLFPADPAWVQKARPRDHRFAAQVWDQAADGYCASWPVPHSPDSDAAPVTSEIPALLISGAFDPRTPPSWAEAAVKRLAHGTSFVLPGQGHGVLSRGQPCAKRIAGRFLDDPSQRPDHDCFAKLAPMIFEPPEQWQARRP
ncbi:alpha/beta hydrolase [Inquilinus sp.]|jgi:pimeloyl-ACP methyl ester carboxylesterase|uniref:alpha/beta hydrolase n=1 Tax=Inquilinus sp. TaxID=1932117 RepID=UPI003784923A